MSNKKGIEKHCEYLESKIRKKQLKIDNLRQEKENIIKYLEEQIELYSDVHIVEDSQYRYDLSEEIRRAYQNILKRIKE